MTTRNAIDTSQLSIALLAPCDVDTTTPAWQTAEREGRDMHEHSMALAQAESLRTSFKPDHDAS